MESIKTYLVSFLLITFLVLVTLIVYWPGLNGAFLLDDYETLGALKNFGGVTNLETLKHFVFGNTSGPTGRPVSMLSFLLNDQYWPSDPWSFKYTNLMIHILCGLLIGLLTFNFSLILNLKEKESQFIAIACSAIWLLHPLNVSTTLYVVQRMTQLSALFTLAGLYIYLIGRISIDINRLRGFLLLIIGLFVFGALASFSKENGILIIVFISVIELTILKNRPMNNLTKTWHFVFILLPLLLATIYVIATWDNFANSFSARDFTMSEKLLTESRILVTYLSLILLPRLKGMGLFHDDILISTSLFSPVTTILSILLIFGLLFAAFYYRRKAPVLSFAVFWFFGGHILESSFYNLELYFEHRNYLPMIGPIFAFVYYLNKARKHSVVESYKKIITAIPVIYLIFLGFLTYQASIIWSHPAQMFPIWANDHPNSYRAQVTYAQFLELADKPDLALNVLANSYKKHPEDISLPIAMFNLSCNTRVYSPYSISEITQLAKHAKYKSSLKHTVSKLIENTSNESCTNISNKEIHDLLYAIKKIPTVVSRNRVMAKLSFQHAELYVTEGNLSAAMSLFDQAQNYQRNPAIALRQATVLITAGLYPAALQYLNKAKELDSHRRFLRPSRENEILVLENYIQSLLKNAKS